MTLFVASFLISHFGCYRDNVHYVPLGPVGEIDYYGPVMFGEIPPQVYERIKDREAEVVSKGFVMRYWEMKERLEDLGEYIWD
jgi:hypothetical protein